MNEKDKFTRGFLRELDLPCDEETIKYYTYAWWVNARQKDSGGLRLTVAGMTMLQLINLKTYEITFPEDMPFNNRVLVYLDRFIDCPWFLTKKSIVVTSERKATELSLFAGDVHKYGYNKAKQRLTKKK